MFPRALRIGRLGGVDIRVDPTWLVIALLVGWTLYTRFGATDRTAAVTLGMAVVGALLFFASVLVHELAHALEAQHRGIEVSGITLFLFGGVTEMHLEAQRPRDEFAVSAVGPYASLVTSAAFGITATLADAFDRPLVAEVAGLLGWLNLALAVFNLIPGAPLDGGRVLRALVWAVSGDRLRAIRVASYAGQLVAAGLWALALRAVLVTPGGLFDALWWALIGWFLWQAATAERRRATTDAFLAGRTVRDLLAEPVLVATADQPLDRVVDALPAGTRIDAVPVVAASPTGTRIVGALRTRDLLAVDPADRPYRDAADLMEPVERLPSVPLHEPVAAVLSRLESGTLLRVVEPDGTVVQLLATSDVGAAIQRLRAGEPR